jgi:transcriptional regulator with GAF, ATPase, and Fis domain
MKPTLVAVFGPLQGSSLEINEQEVSIGRDIANRLSIQDPLLSRKHCMIKREGGSFQITDLNSRNGIFVNGIPLKKHVLKHGDQIEIGDSLFMFLIQEEPKQTPEKGTELDAGAIVAHSTTRLRVEDALYLRPEKLKAIPASRNRTVADMGILLKISNTLHSLQSPEELQQKLFEFILETIPADRAVSFLYRSPSGKFQTTHSFQRPETGNERIPVSQTIIDSVYNEGIAILANDIESDTKYNRVESLIASRIQSILCVPLTVFQEKLGVIYLDTRRANTKFNEDDLELLSAIAVIAAVGLKNAGRLEWLQEEKDRLQHEVLHHQMIGDSSSMQTVYEMIRKVAATDSNVLLYGESGTGKELAARAIHSNSSRSQKPFVAINCATLSETLLESELFGHEKGSFTGALAQKKGKFEVADGGTIFLDEVSEIPLMLQSKLLRVLQEREFERVGGTQPIQVDIRLIAATNRNLEEAIRAGAFRQDLFFRLNVIAIRMPSLRERVEDIPLLANYFLSKFCKKFHKRFQGISKEAHLSLRNYDWLGNVRELENAIERAVVLSQGEIVGCEDLPESLTEGYQTAEADLPKYHVSVKEKKKQLILEAVKQAEGNQAEAARLLGLHPTYLSRLIRNLNLRQALKDY